MTEGGTECIRCDKVVAENYPDRGDYRLLTYNQETGAVPVCFECFDVVQERDIW